MTSSAPGPRFRTQASNFSWRRRSAAPEDTNTVSMANWRKHSFSRNLEDSFRSTNAARAATFLAGGVRAGAVPKALSISARLVSSMKVIVACRGEDGKTLRGRLTGTKVPLPGLDWWVENEEKLEGRLINPELPGGC